MGSILFLFLEGEGPELVDEKFDALSIFIPRRVDSDRLQDTRCLQLLYDKDRVDQGGVPFLVWSNTLDEVTGGVHQEADQVSKLRRKLII